MMDALEIVIEEDRWRALPFEGLVRTAVQATLADRGVPADQAELSVLACDDARIAALNADFRDKPTPTNVLSWPADDLATDTPGQNPAPPEPGFDGLIELGDIAISYDTCAREAAAADKPMADHVTHLIVHGTLHLLGYDHIHDADAALMEGAEVKILGKLGLDDPYKDI